MFRLNACRRLPVIIYFCCTGFSLIFGLVVSQGLYLVIYDFSVEKMIFSLIYFLFFYLIIIFTSWSVIKKHPYIFRF